MEDDPPRTAPAHEIGQPVDRLSLHEFDERLTLLREELPGSRRPATASASR